MNSDGGRSTTDGPHNPSFSDEAQALLNEADRLSAALRRKLKRALVRWCIRTIIGAFLFSWLAREFSWGRWVLYSWLPLCLLSLAVIIHGFRSMSRRRASIEAAVESTR